MTCNPRKWLRVFFSFFKALNDDDPESTYAAYLLVASKAEAAERDELLTRYARGTMTSAPREFVPSAATLAQELHKVADELYRKQLMQEQQNKVLAERASRAVAEIAPPPEPGKDREAFMLQHLARTQAFTEAHRARAKELGLDL